MIATISNQQNTWTRATLNEFCGQRGQSIEPSKMPDSQFELYSVPSFPTGQPEIVSGKEVGSNKQMVTSECVLLCKINPRINRAWVVGHFSQHTKIASTEWIVFPPDKRVEPRFLCYFLQQNAVRDFLASNVSGVGGSLMRVKPSTLRDFPFAYPERDEQSSIVAEIEKQFSRLDEAVANLKRVKANLKRYKASVLKAAVEGKLTAITSMLSPTPFGELIEGLSQGWSPKCDLTRDPLPNEWAIIKTTAVQSMRYFDSESKPLPSKLAPRSNIEIKAGDFLMTRKGPRQRAGVACLVRKTRSRLMVCDTVYRFRCIESRVSPAYLELALNSPLIVSEIDRRKSGISDSGVSLTHDKLGSVLVPIPQLAEQEPIVAEVERRLSVIEELEAAVEANLTRADRLRQSILSTAFSGRLAVSNSGTVRQANNLVTQY